MFSPSPKFQRHQQHISWTHSPRLVIRINAIPTLEGKCKISKMAESGNMSTNRHNGRPKRMVMCCDGTWMDQLGKKG
jgi:hypothetical protein